MKILVIGSGGREHALVWKLKQSPQVTDIFCAPGNAGIAQLAACVSLKISDPAAVVKFVKEKHIDLTVIGSGAASGERISRCPRGKQPKSFRTSKAAAQLEGKQSIFEEFHAAQ